MTENIRKAVLANGNRMPMQGIGTLQIRDDEVCAQRIYDAIRAGIRMIDTAPSYFNERAVGRGIRRALQEGIVDREELFIVTKLWIHDATAERAEWALRQSLDRLGLSYIDLYLIHQPYGKYPEAWPVLEQLVRKGLIRNIGVSNFSEEKLRELMQFAEIPPAVNQIEIHPYFGHRELISFLRDRQIMPMAWGSLCEGQHEIFRNPAITAIGEKYHKTTAQVILRWHLENGIPALFKSVHESFIQENTDIYDFSLTEEEKKIIESYDMGYSEIVDYGNPRTEKWMTGWNIYEGEGESVKWNTGHLAMA